LISQLQIVTVYPGYFPDNPVILITSCQLGCLDLSFFQPSSHLEVSRRCTVRHSQKTSEIIRVSTAGKIHVANVQDGRQPATTPGPGHNNWVDEAGHQKGEDGVGGALHTFRHGTTHNGGTSSAKGPLEEPAQPFSGRFNKYLNITKLGFSFEFVFLKSNMDF